MKKICILTLLGVFLFFNVKHSEATNGTQLIGIGALARSVGGVSIAAPQEEITAVFANPAAMCVRGRCSAAGFELGSTFFSPDIETKVELGGNTYKAYSKSRTYMIPFLGASAHVGESWRFGFAAYGISGLGVEYDNTAVDKPSYYDLSAMYGAPSGSITSPLAAGTDTQLSIMKVAPAVTYQPIEELSFGANLQVDYGKMDLNYDTQEEYGLGVQFGTQYRLNYYSVIGATYVTRQVMKYENAVDLDGDSLTDDLELSMPQQAGIGIAVDALKDESLVVGSDLKWINWEGAEGYEDFDWQDQWVISLGAQYRALKNLNLRAGYNYGNNPVKTHNNFNGSDTITVQNKTLPKYYYETFRVVGFPAITTHHLTLGVEYVFSDSMQLHLGFVHAFEQTFTQEGFDLMGNPVKLESSLSQNSFDFSYNWRF